MENLQAELIKVTKKLEKTKNKPLEDSDIRDILTSLRDSLSTLLDISIENVESKATINSLSTKVRNLEDYTEHHHQRSLRGKFFITFPKDSPPPSPQDLLKEDSNIIDYTCKIVNAKYEIKLDPTCFKTCHFTKKGIVFRL